MEEKQMIQFFASKQDLLDLEERIDRNMDKKIDKVLIVMDEQTGILRKLEQEMTFGSHRVNKLEDRVTETEVDIADLKIKVAIA